MIPETITPRVVAVGAVVSQKKTAVPCMHKLFFGSRRRRGDLEQHKALEEISLAAHLVTHGIRDHGECGAMAGVAIGWRRLCLL